MSAIDRPVPLPLAPVAPDARPAVPLQQAILAGLIGYEVIVFALIGRNFLSWGNFSDNVVRLNVEVGLLALALTPVIVTGGIDLSVGSLLGLCAVLFGIMTRGWGWPIGVAAVLTLAVGGVAGLVNASLITRLRLPPLIVTLGSLALFRGVAEAITGGYENYSDYPRAFLFLGNGRVAGVPAQLPILLAAAIGFYLLLHRTTIGRALSAIGYSPDGARHAGIPVDRRVALAYVLTGLMSAVAAIVYVARVGQAKADAGTGYELLAITAVVLGGTSIFGGRGTVVGTVLGLFAIAILQNGFRMADQRPEVAGILTGVLLLVATGLDRRPGGGGNARAAAASLTSTPQASEEFEMRNSQLAALCAVILAAALIVVGGNVLLVSSIQQQQQQAGAGPAAGGRAGTGPSAGRRTTIAMMPKSLGNAYFIALHNGAMDAAKELNVDLLWDGPTDPDPAKQNEIVDTWVTRGVDVIAVACENKDGIATALQRAREQGIKVVTYDADTQPQARDFFVNQATPEGIGFTLMDQAAKSMGGKGEFAIITASLTASNMNAWHATIKQRLAEKYPDIKLVDYRPCDDVQDKAFSEAKIILNKYPNVKVIMAICSPAAPGAAEAVKQSGRTDVKVIGVSLPNANKAYVHAGITDAIILWNTMDLGYLTVHAAEALQRGTLKPGDKTFKAPRLGEVKLEGDNIILGTPFVFTKENIDKFDF